MKLQYLLSLTRKAVDDYKMIQEGDHIAIGISGGKDSLALLYALSCLRKFYPLNYTLEAITIDLGFEGFDLSEINELCQELQVLYHIIKTDIGEIIFHDRKETNPCSLCSKMRKGSFNEAAKRLGCNKSAYAHHKDDVIDTMLMSLLYEGRFHTFSPVTYLDRMDITLIRPLIYVEEQELISFREAYHLPVRKNPCPADGYTKRTYVKELIQKLEEEQPGVKQRFFHAVQSSASDAWKYQS